MLDRSAGRHARETSRYSGAEKVSLPVQPLKDISPDARSPATDAPGTVPCCLPARLCRAPLSPHIRLQSLLHYSREESKGEKKKRNSERERERERRTTQPTPISPSLHSNGLKYLSGLRADPRRKRRRGGGEKDGTSSGRVTDESGDEDGCSVVLAPERKRLRTSPHAILPSVDVSSFPLLPNHETCHYPVSTKHSEPE